ncbi:MAG: prolyl oligopeptidase family serine peptidase [Acidobacteria bacterium]|nr:prolyl oligopeptidase family serine peptidase [Acidobacteriota bacterium]
MGDTFPRQHARTQRLTLGEPRNFTVSPDGTRAVFARSASGSDPVNQLWSLDVASGAEKCLFDPRAAVESAGELTAEERRRRERAREGAGGVVAYACDAATTIATTVLGGQLFAIDLVAGGAKPVPVDTGVFDARPSPDGSSIAYTRAGRLYVANAAGDEREIAGDDDPNVTWGLAEFIAAEEMGRQRGYWWSPDGRHIAATRVDVSHVPVWHIADPANPATPAGEHRYPAAGATNAEVSLWIIDVTTRERRRVDLPAHEYLNSVAWSAAGLIAQVQSRDQRSVTIVRIDETTGNCATIGTDSDPSWVEIVPGSPALQPNGSLVTCSDRGVRRILVDGVVATPDNLQVRAIVSVGDEVVFCANDVSTPWFQGVYTLGPKGLRVVAAGDAVVSASHGGGRTVVRESSLRDPRASFRVVNGPSIANHAETMLVSPNVRIVEVAGCAVAIVSPNDGEVTELPVLFDPYGGPHAQRVVATQMAFATSQWFADQGFIVVVADGRGTPGRGSAYERAVHGDLAAPVLADQVAVLDALGAIEPRADLSRVAIRGWSFGGYLAALAVLRRPDKFHCAVAGAPVTDWALYDTHYTERYLGTPATDAVNYGRTNLVAEAASLTRPLLLIHGLADDNVVAAHTLQLSSALLAAGCDHEVLPLSGVTHMTPQEVVAENLLLHQLAFIRRSLR